MSDVPVALITGAAGGIGAATACEFARRGHSLALVDCDRQSLDRVIAQIRSLGSEALGLVGDLADLAFGEQAVQEAAAHFGRIDVLVTADLARDRDHARDQRRVLGADPPRRADDAGLPRPLGVPGSWKPASRA